MESLSNFPLIPMGLNMRSQTVLQDRKCYRGDLLHLDYLECLWGFLNGAGIYWVLRTNPETQEWLLNGQNDHPEQ